MQIQSSKSRSISLTEDRAELSARAAADPSQQESSESNAEHSENPDLCSTCVERSESGSAAPNESPDRPAAEGSEVAFETASSLINPDSLELSRFDQPTLVVLLLISSLAVIGWSLWQSSFLRSRTLDIDEARRSPLVFVVDLNVASAAELANLPGVGPRLAEAIIAYRRERGRFSTPADLLNVSGIGEAKLKAILPYLRPLEQIMEPDSPRSGPAEVR